MLLGEAYYFICMHLYGSFNTEIVYAVLLFLF